MVAGCVCCGGEDGPGQLVEGRAADARGVGPVRPVQADLLVRRARLQYLVSRVDTLAKLLGNFLFERLVFRHLQTRKREEQFSDSPLLAQCTVCT